MITKWHIQNSFIISYYVLIKVPLLLWKPTNAIYISIFGASAFTISVNYIVSTGCLIISTCLYPSILL